MPKVSRREMDENDIFSWEDSYGTDTIEWFEKYQLNLPYWVGYMPEPERSEYVAHIRKTRDFN